MKERGKKLFLLKGISWIKRLIHDIIAISHLSIPSRLGQNWHATNLFGSRKIAIDI